MADAVDVAFATLFLAVAKAISMGHTIDGAPHELWPYDRNNYDRAKGAALKVLSSMTRKFPPDTTPAQYEAWADQLAAELYRLGPLQALLDDHDVIEIRIAAKHDVTVQRRNLVVDGAGVAFLTDLGAKIVLERAWATGVPGFTLSGPALPATWRRVGDGNDGAYVDDADAFVPPAPRKG